MGAKSTAVARHVRFDQLLICFLVRRPTPSTKEDELEPASLPARLLSYLVVHTIGRPLMYPGSIGAMNSLLGR